jgi:hypothetical protein
VAHLVADTLYKVVTAMLAVSLDCEVLEANLPPEVTAALPRAPERSRAEHLLLFLSHLNHWQYPGDEAQLIRTVLKNAHLLAGQRLEATVFEGALAELDRTTGALAITSDAQRHDLYTKRVKRFYASCGYDVMPLPDADPSPIFYAWRGVGILSVIAVAVGSIDEVIASVQQSMRQLGPNEPLVEGCVVLPSDQSSNAARVWSAALRPINYGELQPMGFREIENLVMQQHARFITDHAPEALDDRVDETLEDRLRRDLRDDGTRLLVLPVRHARTARRALERIVSACSTDFELKPNAPAPLVLSIPERPPARLTDLIGGVFRDHGVPYSPIALPRLLEEGALLPIFDVTGVLSSSAPALDFLREALVGRTKGVLLLPSSPKVLTIDLARRLRAAPSCVRLLEESYHGRE